jgi:hypothetical protein
MQQSWFNNCCFDFKPDISEGLTVLLVSSTSLDHLFCVTGININGVVSRTMAMTSRSGATLL